MVNRLTIKYWCIRGTAGQVDLPVGQPIFMMKSPNRAGEFFSVIVSLSLFLWFYSLSFDSVLQNGFVFSTDQQTSMSYLPWDFYQHYKDCTLSVCDWVLAFWSANQKICWIEITQHIEPKIFNSVVESFLSSCFSSMEATHTLFFQHFKTSNSVNVETEWLNSSRGNFLL